MAIYNRFFLKNLLLWKLWICFWICLFFLKEKEIWDTLIILQLKEKEKLKKCENWQIDLCIVFVLNPILIRLSHVFGLGFFYICINFPFFNWFSWNNFAKILLGNWFLNKKRCLKILLLLTKMKIWIKTLLLLNKFDFALEILLKFEQ